MFRLNTPLNEDYLDVPYAPRLRIPQICKKYEIINKNLLGCCVIRKCDILYQDNTHWPAMEYPLIDLLACGKLLDGDAAASRMREGVSNFNERNIITPYQIYYQLDKKMKAERNDDDGDIGDDSVVPICLPKTQGYLVEESLLDDAIGVVNSDLVKVSTMNNHDTMKSCAGFPFLLPSSVPTVIDYDILDGAIRHKDKDDMNVSIEDNHISNDQAASLFLLDMLSSNTFSATKIPLLLSIEDISFKRDLFLQDIIFKDTVCESDQRSSMPFFRSARGTKEPDGTGGFGICGKAFTKSFMTTTSSTSRQTRDLFGFGESLQSCMNVVSQKQELVSSEETSRKCLLQMIGRLVGKSGLESARTVYVDKDLHIDDLSLEFDSSSTNNSITSRIDSRETFLESRTLTLPFHIKPSKALPKSFIGSTYAKNDKVIDKLLGNGCIGAFIPLPYSVAHTDYRKYCQEQIQFHDLLLTQDSMKGNGFDRVARDSIDKRLPFVSHPTTSYSVSDHSSSGKMRIIPMQQRASSFSVEVLTDNVISRIDYMNVQQLVKEAIVNRDILLMRKAVDKGLAQYFPFLADTGKSAAETGLQQFLGTTTGIEDEFSTVEIGPTQESCDEVSLKTNAVKEREGESEKMVSGALASVLPVAEPLREVVMSPVNVDKEDKSSHLSSSAVTSTQVGVTNFPTQTRAHPQASPQSSISAATDIEVLFEYADDENLFYSENQAILMSASDEMMGMAMGAQLSSSFTQDFFQPMQGGNAMNEVNKVDNLNDQQVPNYNHSKVSTGIALQASATNTATTSAADMIDDHIRRGMSEEHSFTIPLEKQVLSYREDDSLSLSGLQILISEEFMEDSPWVIAALSSQYRIICHDHALEYPVTMIVDARTAVCLIGAEQIEDRFKLKEFVKSLTKITFKFQAIWILIVHVTPLVTGIFHAGLMQSLSQFPARTIVRDVYPDTLVNIVFAVCKDACSHAAMNLRAIKSDYLHRPFLLCFENVQKHADTAGVTSKEKKNKKKSSRVLVSAKPDKTIAIVHCEYLQQFPTINYYMAGELLARYTLKQLVKLSVENVQKNRTICPPLPIPNMRDFFTLIKTNIGLVQTGSSGKGTDKDTGSNISINKTTDVDRSDPTRGSAAGSGMSRYSRPKPSVASSTIDPKALINHRYGSSRSSESLGHNEPGHDAVNEKLNGSVSSSSGSKDFSQFSHREGGGQRNKSQHTRDTSRDYPPAPISPPSAVRSKLSPFRTPSAKQRNMQQGIGADSVCDSTIGDTGGGSVDRSSTSSVGSNRSTKKPPVGRPRPHNKGLGLAMPSYQDMANEEHTGKKSKGGVQSKIVYMKKY